MAMAEGGKTMDQVASLSRKFSSRKFDRSNSILEPGSFLRSTSMILHSEEVTVEPPAPVEQPALDFERLEPLDVKPDDLIPEGPAGATVGVLKNGMRYYVGRNAKPQQRAALALAVNVGSIQEEDGDQGVAHIVEHLAFNATTDHANFDIVRFLERIGSQFGACQNARTSTDETVYEILVPIDQPDTLSEALHILAEFSRETRASDEDLEKERGAVLEEWRRTKTASGRLSTAYWKDLMKGSKYADRLPIGLESVIRNVPGQRVRDFYHKWYRPERMAIVAVGDFQDFEDVIELIKLQFAAKQSHDQHTSPLAASTFPVPPHKEPHLSCYVDAELNGSAQVDILFKIPAVNQFTTVRGNRQHIAKRMFNRALSQRFYKISKQKDPPFFSCIAYSENLTRSTDCQTIQATCPEGGTLQALEHMLMEVSRVRLHGFSEREMAVARAEVMSSMRSAYLERDQFQSTQWRDIYVEHFLAGMGFPGVEYQARLWKTLVPDISAMEVTRVADYYNTTCSCNIRTIEPQVSSNDGDLKAVVARVKELESRDDIASWGEDNLPNDLLEELPTPGTIIETKEVSEFEATEITLSNGMRVCYKCTDYLDDQILVNGYAYGGISEIDESNYANCIMASSFADETGVFGHKPTILSELLAGKRAWLSTNLGYYTHSFDVECSPSDLETALKLVYQLFVTEVTEPADEEVKLVMQRVLEGIKADERDPITAYQNRATAINFGTSYFYKPFTAEWVSTADPKRGCQYFDQCYKDPSTFTVIIAGAVNVDEALPLILKYLGGIRRPETPVMNYKRENLAIVSLNGSSQILREEVRRHMVEDQCEVYLTFPVHLHGPRVVEDVEYTSYICRFLKTKIMQLLRFKHGKVYSANVSAYLGGTNPFIFEEKFGHVSVKFSCDPDKAWELVDLTLEEIKQLQEVEPVDETVTTVLELEQRDYEILQQDNEYWVGRLRQAYQSAAYDGDLEGVLKEQDQLRDAVRSETNDTTMREALCRILPVPCTKLYRVVVLMPEEKKEEDEEKEEVPENPEFQQLLTIHT